MPKTSYNDTAIKVIGHLTVVVSMRGKFTKTHYPQTVLRVVRGGEVICDLHLEYAGKGASEAACGEDWPLVREMMFACMESIEPYPVYGTAGSRILVCDKCKVERFRNPMTVKLENEWCYTCKVPMRFANCYDFANNLLNDIDLKEPKTLLGRVVDGTLERYYEIADLSWHCWRHYVNPEAYPYPSSRDGEQGNGGSEALG